MSILVLQKLKNEAREASPRPASTFLLEFTETFNYHQLPLLN